jgi:hypothetical protein
VIQWQKKNADGKHWLILTIGKTGLLQVASLLDHLIQLSKTGFSKTTQRLDGIYALFAVLRLAAVDTKAGFHNFLYPCAFFCMLASTFCLKYGLMNMQMVPF